MALGTFPQLRAYFEPNRRLLGKMPPRSAAWIAVSKAVSRLRYLPAGHISDDRHTRLMAEAIALQVRHPDLDRSVYIFPSKEAIQSARRMVDCLARRGDSIPAPVVRTEDGRVVLLWQGHGTVIMKQNCYPTLRWLMFDQKGWIRDSVGLEDEDVATILAEKLKTQRQ